MLSKLKTTALVIGALAVSALGAHAQSQMNLLVQMDDGNAGLTGLTYENGQLIQSAAIGANSYIGTYGLWNSATVASSFDISANIWDPNGTLSDTWDLNGNAGDPFVSMSFISGDDGQNAVTAIPNPTENLTETGNFQTFTTFTVSNGDQYTWQFRSNEVPDSSSTLPLMVAGLAGILALGLVQKRQSVRA